VVEAGPLERHAHDAARVPNHERHRLGRHLLCCDDEVTFVLPVGVVDDDHQLAAPDGGDRVLDRAERHRQIPSREIGVSNRSTYLARRSTSMLTGASASLCPSVVTASVWGITATSTAASPTAATVRLIPSPAIDPFSTT